MRTRERARGQYNRGLRLAESGDQESALSALQAAVAADDTYGRAWAALARCYEQLDRPTWAVDTWRRAAEWLPEDMEVALSLAEALRSVGCYHPAIAAYDRVLASRGDSVYALAGRGESLRMLGRPTEALQWFERSLSEDPDHVFALRGQAAALNALWRYDEAIVAWERAIDLDPTTPFAEDGLSEARAGLRDAEALGAIEDEPTATANPGPDRQAAESSIAWALALAGDGRVQEALEAAQEAVNRAPNWLDATLEWADLAARAQERTEAATAWNRAGVLNPEDATIARRAAEAADAAGDADTLGLWSRAARLAPRHVATMLGHARALARADRGDEARQVVAEALQVDATSTEAWALRDELARPGRKPDVDARRQATTHVERAVSLSNEGRYQEAIVDLRRAADLDPNWAPPWVHLGLAAVEERQYDVAAAAFLRALDLEPGHAGASLGRADALRRGNRQTEAVEAYESHLSRHDTDRVAMAGLGESLRLIGRCDEAIVRFDAALDGDSNNAFALCGKAAALNTLRRFDEALPVWHSARSLLPDSPFVKRGIQICNSAIESRAVGRRKGATEGTGTAAEELERARELHRQRDLSGAIAACRRALELDPELIDAALRLGLCLEDEHQYEPAIAAYRLVISVDPGHVQAATNIAEALRKDERYQDALSAYDGALAQQPDYLYALAGRAESMRMLGDFEGSLIWFDRALGVRPRHAFAVQGKAASLNALSRFIEAQPLWSLALQIEPNSAFAQEGKAFCDAHVADGSLPEIVPGVESTTPMLDEQGRDLTALARAGCLPTVVGRDAEVRQVLKTLVRRLKANPLLLGEPGVGKTAVVEAVAQRLVGDKVPPRLRQTRLIELTVGSLVAGTKYRGTFEERLRDLIKEARENPGIVLFVDEIHTLVGAGRTEGGSLDAANILKPALARGEIQIIGATTLAEYRKHFESDGALDRRFQPVTVDEPDEASSVKLLEALRGDYERHHDVTVEPAAITACVRLAIRYLPERRLPDKALDLLDESCADASLEGAAVVTPSIVARVVSERTGVPAHELSQTDRRRIAGLEAVISKRVAGQPVAVSRLVGAVRTARANLRSPDRPRGVFLFAGPSGTGKTEMAKALADALFPEGGALLRIDMGEFTERFTATRLTGAPPGYSGHGEEGQLAGPLRRRPYSVVLLDEFEKAHPDVAATFLTLFDEGHITDSAGRKIHAREAWFVITTNVAESEGAKARMGFGSESASARHEATLERLRRVLRPELLQRIDETIVFSGLGPDALETVVATHLGRLRERVVEQGGSLAWDPGIPALIARHVPDPAGGARAALRALEELVAAPLAEQLIATTTRSLRASLRDGHVVIEPEIRGQRVGQDVDAVS